LRAVLDPNVMISGLLSPAGSPADVLRAWRDGRFHAIISPLLLAELERALTYPKLRRRIPPADAEAAMHWLRAGATLVEDPAESSPVHSEDPGDDHLIVLAAHQRAALVSGDRHLLSLADRIPV
jgi:putative PIN family toxin of toxin-antitoxin system